jgi:ankyrin repeat protein
MRLLILILSFIFAILTSKIVNHKLDSILSESVNNGDIDCIRELFAGHIIPDINAKDDYGQTVLHYAAMYDNAYITKMLIDNSADINAKTNDGWTTLHYAAAHDRLHVAQMLIDNGANINAKDTIGETALMCAARHDRRNLVKMLIDAGANVDARDNNDLTARDYFSNKDEFDRIVSKRKEYIAKVRSLIQEQDQLIPDLGNIITEYI